MNKTEHKKAISEIKRLWNKAEYILNNKCMKRSGEELLKMNRAESKRHDRFRGDSISRGLTITEESKFFAIKQLCEYLYNLEKAPLVKYFDSTLTSCYLAYSLAKRYTKYLKERITKEEAMFLHDLDYCEVTAGS